MFNINLPNLNGDAQVEQLARDAVRRSSEGCLRCCDTLDWTNTSKMKMYQEGQGNSVKDARDAPGASELLVVIVIMECQDDRQEESKRNSPVNIVKRK